MSEWWLFFHLWQLQSRDEIINYALTIVTQHIKQPLEMKRQCGELQRPIRQTACLSNSPLTLPKSLWINYTTGDLDTGHHCANLSVTASVNRLLYELNRGVRKMDEIRKREGGKERWSCWGNSLMRGMDYWYYTYTHTYTRATLIYTRSAPKCRFILKLEIVCLWDWKGGDPQNPTPPLPSPPLPSPLSQAGGRDRVDLNPFWLHFILLAVHRVPVQRWSFASIAAATTHFLPPFSSCGLWCHSGIFLLGFVSLYSSHPLSNSLHTPSHCRPQTAPWSCEDKRLDN